MNNNEEMTVPKKLYHYTSKEGFLGIIENKTLWASEILFMNDGKEACIPLEILKELLEENKNEWKDFLELYESVRGVETYVISFSEKKDDLNMWRAYGDNASGICIEFNSCNLFESLRNNQIKIELTFEKNICDKQEQKNVIQSLLDSEKENSDLNMWRAYDDTGSSVFIEFYNRFDASKESQEKIELSWKKCIYDKQEQKNEIQSLLDSEKASKGLFDASFFEKLLKFSPYFKDESFRDEKEWRIIVKLDTGENRELKNVRFRKDIFVPYCELRIEKEKIPREDVEDEYPWLGDITVGHNTTDIFYDSVLHACSVYGIGFGRVLEREPRKSDIPYRG